MKINGNKITLYDKDGKIFQSIDEFLNYYNEQYYLINNEEVENKIKEILENGMRSKEDLFRVLAWVFIKIDMKKSKGNAFVYYEGMDEESMQLRIYSNDDIVDKSNIEEIYEIIKEYSENCDTDDKAQSFLNELRDYTSEKHWGKYFYSVYMITLLYFVSKGKYPIVNSSSYVALEAIHKKAPFGEKFDPPKFVQPYDSGFEEIITKGAYKEYRDKLNNFVELIKESDLRKVDQALWVYGKLFKKN